MQRQITEIEIKKAHELYLIKSKPFIDRLFEIHKWLIPKIIQTEKEVRVFYEETEEMLVLRNHLEDLLTQIKVDLECGKFF